jgi:hypothetical protein
LNHLRTHYIYPSTSRSHFVDRFQQLPSPRQFPWTVILSRAKYHPNLESPISLSLFYIYLPVFYIIISYTLPVKPQFIPFFLSCRSHIPTSTSTSHAIHHPIHPLGTGSLHLYRNQSHGSPRLFFGPLSRGRSSEQEAKDFHGMQVLPTTVSLVSFHATRSIFASHPIFPRPKQLTPTQSLPTTTFKGSC